MVSQVEGGLVIFHIVLNLISILPFLCIRGYLRNKAPGMQTVFDKAVISFTIILQTVIFCFSSSVTIGIFVRYLKIPNHCS